jgi:hypothetical protein
MSSTLYKALMLFVGLALIRAVGTWWRARQELRVVTEANAFVRKTLGDLTVAMAEKDREIGHLTKTPCNTSESTQLRSGTATAGAAQP